MPTKNQWVRKFRTPHLNDLLVHGWWCWVARTRHPNNLKEKWYCSLCVADLPVWFMLTKQLYDYEILKLYAVATSMTWILPLFHWVYLNEVMWLEVPMRLIGLSVIPLSGPMIAPKKLVIKFQPEWDLKKNFW